MKVEIVVLTHSLQSKIRGGEGVGGSASPCRRSGGCKIKRGKKKI